MRTMTWNPAAKPAIAVLAAATLLLAACGESKSDRAITGAGTGAAVGAAVGAVTGLTIVQGALLGAAAGGVTGAVTSKDDINLGTPAWRKNGSSGSASSVPPSQQPPKATTASVPAQSNVVWRTQSALAARGYDPGSIDGIMGRRTRDAIERYQAQNGLVVDGQPTEDLIRHIEGRS